MSFMSESVWPVFSSRNFIVSGLISRSLINFEFIFVCSFSECSNLTCIFFFFAPCVANGSSQVELELQLLAYCSAGSELCL